MRRDDTGIDHESQERYRRLGVRRWEKKDHGGWGPVDSSETADGQTTMEEEGHGNNSHEVTEG